MAMVSSSSSSQLSGSAGDPAARKASSGSSGALISSMRTTVRPERSSGRDGREQFGIDQQEAGFGVAEDITDFVGAEAGVDRNQDAPGGGDGKMRFEQRGGVGAEDGDAVVLLEAEVAQAVGAAVDALGDFAPGAAHIAVDDRDFIGEDVGGAAQEGDGVVRRGRLVGVTWLAPWEVAAPKSPTCGGL